MSYFLRKTSSSPVRYSLYNQDQVILNFGIITFKEFFAKLEVSSDKINIDDYWKSHLNFIETLKNFENEVLRQEIFNYLAGQETSPAKLDRWLSQRQLDREERKAWVILAKENNFLSLERYIGRVVEQKKSQRQPWWQVKRKLQWELSPYTYLLPFGVDLDDFFLPHRYEDLEVLRNHPPPQRFIDNPEKHKRYLLGKGFSISVIKEYFEELSKDGEGREQRSL